MKKPKIAPFDSSHPIYDEMLNWYRKHFHFQGVYTSSYSGKAHCASCGWTGAYSEFEKARYSCPICNAAETKNAYMYSSESYKGTLIIDKRDGVIIFRFIGFEYHVNENGEDFFAEEMYRIYTDKVDYEIYKLSDGKTLKKHASAEMDYNRYFKDMDVYEHHNYEANVCSDDFIKTLAILDEDTILENVFKDIAKNAAKNSVAYTCPVFNKPPLTEDFLLKTNYKNISKIIHHVEKQNIGNAAVYNAWCGKCGKFATATFPASYTSPRVDLSCDCAIGSVYVGTNRYEVVTNGGMNVYIDVQFENDCTVLRYTNFSIISSLVNQAFIPSFDAKTELSARIEQIYYVCCFADGKVAVFNENYEPLTPFEVENTVFVESVANSDIEQILENDNFTKNIGFVDYAKMNNNYSLQYFFGCMKTELVKELVACNLHSLIFDMARPSSAKLPVYLQKNNGKFTANMFTPEQIEDFALHYVMVDYFVGFMQIFKKDITILYGDYCALSDVAGKNSIAEIYRRIPDIRFDKAYNYIAYLNGEEALSPVESIPLWCGYLNTAKNLKLDLTKDAVCFPKSLKMTSDVLSRTLRERNLSEQEIEEYAENAKKANVHYEDERWCIKTVENIDEFIKHKNALMNSQALYYHNVINRISLVVYDKRRDCIKYLIDLDGEFVNDTLTSAKLIQFYAFGNTALHGRNNYYRIVKANSALSAVFKKYKIN